MNVCIESIANANYLSLIEIKTPLNQICFSDKTSQMIFHDFIRHTIRGWKISPQSQFGLFLAFQQGIFQARCFETADKVIRDYNGSSWKISKNGIYCILSKPSDRFIVESPNYTVAECNPLEAGIVVTLMALDSLMLSNNKQFATAMCFYHEYLKTLIREQANAEKPLIDAKKVFALLD